MQRLYCTVDELLTDLGSEGVRNSSERVLWMIKQASEWIDRNIGMFIPLTETRRFDGDGTRELYVSPPVLAVTSVIDDETTLETTDYLLYPRNRLWSGGPYMRLVIDPDASSLYNWTAERDIVVITGRWGLYEESKSTGAEVASQAEDALTLTVDNGAVVSPGAVLLIESEQELVTGVSTPTDSTANTNGAITNEADTLTLTDASLVNIGEVVRVNFEQMKIVDISGNDLLVTRGWNQTKRAAHEDAQDVYVYRTFIVERGANGTTAAEHTSQAISRYVPPADVNWLCKQMAGLMLKKADSGFSGKVGNAELGETFYYSEFPKAVIDRVAGNYFVPRI